MIHEDVYFLSLSHILSHITSRVYIDIHLLGNGKGVKGKCDISIFIVLNTPKKYFFLQKIDITYIPNIALMKNI